MKFLEALDRNMGRLETALLILSLSLMILLGSLQVLLRNLFSTGLPWTDIFLRNLVLWIAFLGASLATQEKRHLKIELLSNLLPPAAKTWVDVFISLFSAVVCLLLGKAAYDFVYSEYEFGSMLFHRVPAWTMEAIIPAAFLVIAFRFLLHSVKVVIQGPDPET